MGLKNETKMGLIMVLNSYSMLTMVYSNFVITIIIL